MVLVALVIDITLHLHMTSLLLILLAACPGVTDGTRKYDFGSCAVGFACGALSWEIGDILEILNHACTATGNRLYEHGWNLGVVPLTLPALMDHQDELCIDGGQMLAKRLVRLLEERREDVEDELERLKALMRQ